MSLRRILAAISRRAGIRARLRYCREIDRELRKTGRAFAHTQHRRGVICYGRALRRLPLAHKVGILAHEVGHLAAARVLGWRHSERSADVHARHRTGLRISYRGKGRYGKRGLQWVDLRR